MQSVSVFEISAYYFPFYNGISIFPFIFFCRFFPSNSCKCVYVYTFCFTHESAMHIECTCKFLRCGYICSVHEKKHNRRNSTREDRTRAKERVYSCSQLDKCDYECNGDTEQQNRGKCLPASYTEYQRNERKKKRNQKKNISDEYTFAQR